MNTGYCLKHDEVGYVHRDENGEFHTYIDFSNNSFECCDGPFTSCPPPELPEDWEMVATPPSPDELEQMDANAEELLLEVA